MWCFFLTMALSSAHAQNATFSDTPPQNSVFSSTNSVVNTGQAMVTGGAPGTQPSAATTTGTTTTAAPAASTTSATSSKTDIYEKESSNISFTAKVSTVREISGEVDVYFEGDQVHGSFMLPSNAGNYATMMTDLVESQKNNGPKVSVTADDQQRILSVQPSRSPAKNN